MENKYIGGKEAAEKLGVCQQTLRKYDLQGKIKTFRTPGGKRMYDITSFISEQVKEEIVDTERKKICYCRVSGNGQQVELNNQIELQKKLYPNYELLYDIGSGINFKRKNFNKIIKYGIEGKLDTLVLTYKDRLCRIGYELVENILKENSNTNIIIINDELKSPQEEVVEDLIQIITVFSSRVYGLRSYKKQIESNQNKLLGIL